MRAAPVDQSVLQPLPWLPVLETGFADIDSQHRALIDDANAIHALVVARSDWSKLATAVGRMHRDCQLHFADENKLLSGSGFSDATGHALEHERVLEEIAEIHGIIRATTHPSPLHWELAMTLRSLLIDHFLRYDLKYKSHIMYHQPFGP
jgi:hemerythrin-like metal-binding protein